MHMHQWQTLRAHSCKERDLTSHSNFRARTIKKNRDEMRPFRPFEKKIFASGEAARRGAGIEISPYHMVLLHLLGSGVLLAAKGVPIVEM